MTRRDDRVRVEVLGPIRVLDPEGRDITPDGALQRRLLALLVLHRGHVVSAGSAIEALWPVRPPQDPTGALHNHVSRLRRGLPGDPVASVEDGYRLDPGSIDLDADRLARALTDRGSDDAEGAVALDAVLERWRGPAYPELDDVDDGRTESMRLEDLRIRAREVTAERRLELGDTEGLVAELSALTEAEPRRETPRALLMAALAATGRRVDALRVYDDFRRLLGDELGLEPSPMLSAQQADLLAGEDATAWTPARRLPVSTTSLVGREGLSTEATALTEGHRVVTLLGPGGVGKTRLLLEVGHRLHAGRPDRPVVLAELAAAGDASAVDVVASALAIDSRPGVPLLDRVVGVLGDAAIVVLLDNCEHVVDAAAAVVERLVSQCPHVTVVTTSRERLRVPGEQVCAVPSLPLDDGDGPAVQLFLDRARQVVPHLDPDPSDQACIEEIVRRLDGLPLAIELAAARLHTHDLSEVAAGLGDRFSLLSSGSRTSTRHGSLRATVSWSFSLLDDQLQQTFADVSVFSGPFTAEDAAAVCGHDTASVTTQLTVLVERSLVMRADRRYVLLETLRAYGAERLAATRGTERARDRHARRQVDWIEQADRRLYHDDRPVLAEIDAALPELRTGLDWLLRGDEVEKAGRLVLGLLDHGFMRLRPDVLVWSEDVAAADPDDRSPLASRVWVVAAYAAWMAGDVAGTEARSARALRIAEQAGGVVPSEVGTICGNCELFAGRLEEAVRWYRRAAAAADAVGDAPQRLFVTSTEVLPLAYAGDPVATTLADAVLDEVGTATTPYAAYAWYCAGEADLDGDITRARTRLARAIELAEASNASFVTGIAGASKASIEARVGDPHVAAQDYRRLLTHWQRAGMWSTQWTMLRSVVGLLARLGRHREAAVLEGAVRGTIAGHQIFGADEVALRQVGEQLGDALGEDAYQAALREGAVLDGDAAVEHARRAL